MKKFLTVMVVMGIVAIMGCGKSEEEKKQEKKREEAAVKAEVILYNWDESLTDEKSHPTKVSGREIIILAAARKASGKFVAEKLEEFDKDDLDKNQYLLLTFDKELIDENTIIFSQKGLISPDLFEVRVQKTPSETWSDFYQRGFSELAKKASEGPQGDINPPHLKGKHKPAEALPKEEADASPEPAAADEEDSKLPIYFDWQPNISRELALEYHPYVVEGLDKVVLLAAANLGIEARKLLKLDVEDFNSPVPMVILVYGPEGLKDKSIDFTIRTGDQLITSTFKKKPKEDWLPFYQRGFCDIFKKAKLIKECKVRYTPG